MNRGRWNPGPKPSQETPSAQMTYTFRLPIVARDEMDAWAALRSIIATAAVDMNLMAFIEQSGRMSKPGGTDG